MQPSGSKKVHKGLEPKEEPKGAQISGGSSFGNGGNPTGREDPKARGEERVPQAPPASHAPSPALTPQPKNTPVPQLIRDEPTILRTRKMRSQAPLSGNGHTAHWLSQ